MLRGSSADSLSPLLQITDGVKPTLSELEKFEDQPEGLDLEVVTESGELPWGDPCRGSSVVAEGA